MCDKEFIKDCLTQILGEATSDEIIDYIVTIDNEDDYNEFMENIVDKTNPDHATAYDALKVNLIGAEKKSPQKIGFAVTKTKTEAVASNSNSNHQKNVGKTNRNAENKQKKQQQQQKQQQQNKYDNKFVTKKATQSSSATAATVSKEQEAKQTNRQGGKGKKLKFVNFYGQDLKPGLLKGRHRCNCEARRHNLINNCIKCGRIVCEQEGSGPCFFCDNMVCSNEEMELLAANNKESDKLYNFLMERSRSKEWKKAIEARDRLLLNDSLGSSKNVVYDDECDYFKLDSSGNVIDVPENKKYDKAKMDFYTRGRFPRRDTRMSLNLATRAVTLEEKDGIKNKEKLLKDIHKLMEMHAKQYPKYFSRDQDMNKEANELLKELVAHKTETNREDGNVQRDEASGFSVVDGLQPANAQLQDVVDSGMCLSMHQPYASLLIAGIKKHEGRTWITNHRGRLWIAAASRQPSDDEILECEEMYKNIYCDPSLKFPRTYPVSCLLGCVHVDDCLPQEEYRELYPNGESPSPFVLICRNPVILPLFYPISGQHKIFPLPRDLHRRAKSALLSGTWLD